MTRQSAALGSGVLSTAQRFSLAKLAGRILSVLLGFLLGASCYVAAAQSLLPAWHQQFPVNTPGNRYIHSMAYDAGHSQVVLFGGFNSGDANDTWLWNGTSWTQANPSPSSIPPPRSAPAMVYDPVHNKVVMFGGFVGASVRLNDTWLWDGTNWTQASPTTSPSGRSNDDMVFDAATGQIILFGGTNGSDLGDTWLWDGANWTQANPATSPSARSEYGMAYDPAISQVVLFGGNPGGAVNDTWLWDGSNWTQASPSSNPPARYAHGMEYDQATGKVMVFGGSSGSNVLNDTWSFDGSNWTQAAVAPGTSPSGRYVQNALVYDSAHQQLVMFGGYSGSSKLGDTWVFGLPGNFGNVNVCPAGATAPAPCSTTLAFTYLFANGTTLSATPKIVTQGTAELDFTLNSAQTTCSGTVAPGTCTVSVTFSPLAPGVRMGAIELTSSTGIPQVTTPIYGVGQGPDAVFGSGTQTLLASNMSIPYGVTTDAAGDVFFVDASLGKVYKVAPDGSQTALGVFVSTPTGVAVDGAGDVFITDQGAGKIVELPSGCTSSSCQVTLAASTGVQQQSGIAVDGAGDIFFSSFVPAQVSEIPAGCTTTSCVKVVWIGPTGPGASQPLGLAVDGAGDVFIADGGNSHQVTEVPAGCGTTSCQIIVGSGWLTPTSVAVDAAGNAYVSEANGGVFEVPAGCTSASCRTMVYNGTGSYGVALDGQGNVIVTLLADHSVLKISRSQPPPLTFASTPAGSTSIDSPQSVVLQNIGNQALSAVSPGLLVVTGPNFVNVAGPGTPVDCSATFTLAAGAVCNTSLAFTPQVPGNPLTSTAVFHDNSLNAPAASQTVNLSGVGLNPATYTVGGTVSGVDAGGLVLQDNLGDNVFISGNGSFTFPTALAAGSPYGITILTPSTGQTCAVMNGSGTVGTANITNVQVGCADVASYLLTVTLTGTGTGTVVDNLGQVACSKTSGAAPMTCSGYYPSGTFFTVNANGSNASVFVGWGGACSSSGASVACQVTMNSALSVNASFVAPPAAQAAMLTPITAGTVYGQGGSFTSSASNNGGVTANSLSSSQGVVVDGGGNLYVADGLNNRVLFFPAGSTSATRVYGQNGSFTSNAVNNGGVSANSLNNPQGMALDGSGNLYVADDNNNRVLFYPAGSTTATLVYGQGGSLTSNASNKGGISASSLSDSRGIALDSNRNLYVADFGNSRVLFYPAGSTTATRVYGQGGSFTSNTVNNGGISANSLNQAQAVTVDSSGDLYVADVYNNRVLFYPAGSTTASQVYGQGGSFSSGTANTGGINAGTLNNPLALTVDSSGGLYVVDRSNNRVLYYPFGTQGANRVYGQGGSFNSNAVNNGGVSANSLSAPWGVTTDNSGNVYVADNANNRVLEYGSFGNVNACPANQGTPAPCSKTITYSYAPAANTTIGAAQVVTQGATGLDFTLGAGNTCAGTITEGRSCTVNANFAPLAPGLRTGAVELFDNAGNALASEPLYGVGQAGKLAFGPGVQTTLPLTGLHYNVGVAVDATGNTFVADYTAGKVVKLTPGGVQTTVPTTGVNAPVGVAVDGAGNVYIVDLGLSYVVKVTPGGIQSAVGSGLSNPIGIALDGLGNVFVGDQNNNRVVEITASGSQTTVPFTGLVQPYGVAVDAAGDVFVADGGNSRVVGITPGGVQTALPATGLSQPYGLAVDAAGDVYIADPLHARVVEVSPGGGTQTAVGAGLNYPSGVTVDGAGNVVIGDQGSGQVLKVVRSQPQSFSFAQTNVGSTSLDSPQALNVQNIGNQTLQGSLALTLGGNFRQSNPVDCASFVILPGVSCNENFSFVPQSATFASGNGVFSDNNLNLVSTQTISLSGIGAVGGIAGLVAVPNVVGQTQAAAAAPITTAGLATGTVSSAASSTVPFGSVISQNPVAATQVAAGSAVNLLVSSGQAQPPSPNPLTLENNYFVTGDYVAAGVALRGLGVGGTVTRSITIPSYTQGAANGVPAGADVVDAFLYWETLESTPSASSNSGTFNGYPITGQQIGNDLPSYVDGAFTGTMRSYRASVNAYLPVGANGIRTVSGAYSISLPDGGTALPLTEGASLVMVYRVLSPNFPLKSVVLYDGAAAPAVAGAQVVQGFYDAVGGANGTGKSTNIFTSGGNWNSAPTSVTLGKSNQYSAPLNTASAYAAVILSTPVNNSDNDGILDAWKAGPAAGDFHAGQPGYYDVKTATWVGLPGAKHGQKDLFVQLDYMCGTVLATGACDPNGENLFPSPDTSGNDPLAMVQQAFANSGVQLHLQIGNAVPEGTCVDDLTTVPATLCQFPGQPGVIGWKNSLEFSKLYPRNLAACLTGGDCTTRFPYGQKDSFHYVLMGHSLAIPAWNTRYGTLASITVANGTTTITTADRGAGINACPSRITLGGVIGNPALNGVYNTTGCADTKTISLLTPGVPNWSYPNNKLPEPVIGLTSGTITSISGYSDLGGADSAVTLGLWLTAPNQDMSKKANVLAGTIFHEIGHTLGLSHGGLYFDTPGSYVPTFEGNCKPNYQSVMNYLFQLDLMGPNQTLAFSNQTLNTLNENNAGSVLSLTDASNNPATFPTSAWYVPYMAGSPGSPATRHCDGTPLRGDSASRVDASIAPITPAWANPQDISFTGTPLQASERGFNDLTNMDLRQTGATGGEFASLASVFSFGSSVTPLNISAGGTVAVGSGGTVAVGSGGTVTLGSGGTVTLGSSGTVTLGSGGTVTLGSGGTVTLGSGGTITTGSGGTVTLGSGGTVSVGSGGTVTLGSGGTVTLGSGGTVTLGSGGTVTLGSGGAPITVPSTGGTVTLGSGGTVTLGSGGTVTLGSGGTATLGSGGTVTLGSGGMVTLGSGGIATLGGGGTVTLGSGGTVTLGSGGTVTLGSGGTVTLGSGGTVTLGSGGTVTLGSGGTVTLGSGGNSSSSSGGTVTLGSGGTATLGSGGTVTLGSGGTVTLGSGGNLALSAAGTVTLGSGGTVTLGSGGTVTLGSGGTVTLGSGGAPVTIGIGGTVTLGSGGTVTLGSGGTVTLGSGGTVTLGSGGTVTLGSGGTVTLGSGGTVTLGSGGVVTLGPGGSVSTGSGIGAALGTVGDITPASASPSATDELTYETANSVVRPPIAPTETAMAGSVRINWKAPAFGVVQTYTVYRSSNGAPTMVIGSVSGINGNPPATEFTDTNPDLGAKTVVYNVTTTLVPDSAGPSRQSPLSAPAVIKNDQSISLGPLPSSVLITSPLTITATAMSGINPNGLEVVFSASGSCAIGSQSLSGNVSSASVTLNATGNCILTASQPGTTTFNAANSVSATFMVLPRGSATQSQTITFAPLQSVQYGSHFALSASSTSGLPVGFTASGPCATNGATSGAGVCSITAAVPASGSYSAALVTQSFNIYPAVLTVTASSTSVAHGQTLPALTYTYSGFVKSDTASVVSGAPLLSTSATSSSGAGTYPIVVSTGTLATANYSFLYVNGTLTVQSSSQAPLILMTTSPLAFNQSQSMSVSGGSANGPVTYKLITGPCSVTGARLTANSGSGSCAVSATMAGNSSYNPVTSTTNVVTLSTATQTINFTTNPPASALYNGSFTVAATGGASANPVTFTSAGACRNTGATFTITSSTGTCSVIANQAGNSNYAAAVQVTKAVNVAGPLLSVSTSTINFGTVYFGSITPQVITVTNTGTAPVTITDPILAIVKGGNSNEFVSVNLCPRPLAAGKSCTMLIGFLAGPYYTQQTATLQIMSNAPGSPLPVALSALVINPQAKLSSTSLNFGTIKHATSNTMSVVLSNPGGTPLSLTGVSVAGANAASFIQSNTCGSSLAAGANCTIGVKFTPAKAGTFSATLTVADNATGAGSKQAVALIGNGN